MTITTSAKLNVSIVCYPSPRTFHGGKGYSSFFSFCTLTRATRFCTRSAKRKKYRARKDLVFFGFQQEPSDVVLRM
jgi:hypothetical protein